MQFSQLLLLASLASLATPKLLIDYTGGQAASVLGNVELEGQDLGCKITSAGNAAFIKPEADSSNGTPSLHYKRDPHFRRAEVKALAKGHAYQAEAGKTYYIGYHFRLGAKSPGLAIFQWKKWDKEAAPKQNIPFHVFFDSQNRLSIEYTIPGTNGSNRETVWNGEFTAGIGTEHHLAFAINTAQNGKGSLEFYLDGKKQRFNDKWGGQTKLSDVDLFTGPTSPKFGIYRSEASGGGSEFCPSNGIFTGSKAPNGSPNTYNSWIYRVQISDSSMSEVAEAAGISGI